MYVVWGVDDARKMGPEDEGPRIASEVQKMTFDEYLRLERREMARHKWIESEKAGHDLGNEALFDWIDKHSDAFRRGLRRRVGRHADLPL